MRGAPLRLLALAAACSAPAPARSPAVATIEPTAAVTAAAATPEAEPGAIEIIDVGTEPRYPLRYRAPAGTLRTLEGEKTLQMQASGIAEPYDLPSAILTGSLELVEVADDGSFVVRAIVDGAVQHQERRTLDERGGLLERTVERAGTEGNVLSPRTMTDLYGSAFPRFPTEPVGDGARWRLAERVDMDGVTFDSESEYELIDVTATMFRLRSTVQLRAEPQTWASPGGQVPVEGTGTVTTHVYLDRTTLVSEHVSESELTLITENNGEPFQITITGRSSAQWR